MSNVAKKIGKKSLIAAVALDLIGILISFLVNANLTNVVLLRIVLFCYCIRFELIAILIILVFFYIFFLFLKNARKVNPSLFSILILLIIVAFVFSFRPIRQFVIARYYYFNNSFYKNESQDRFLINATFQLIEKNWDLVEKNLEQADGLYPESNFTIRISNAFEELNNINKYGDQLHESYIKPITPEIALNKFRCAQTLYTLYPKKYGTEYLELRDSVVTAINTYKRLYESIDMEDYKECRELILKYGWCWFEPIINEKLSYDNEAKVMEWLNQYIGNEDLYSAQKRLETNWFGKDSVYTD